MNKPFIVLSGAVKNIGDFLIFDRSLKLLRKYVSENLKEYKRSTHFDDIEDEVNNSRGVIICGGPGYSTDMYPEIYPLVSNFERLKVPIIPLGVGWSGKPKNAPEQFQFSEQSRRAMDYIESASGLYSCRDEITETVLHKEKYNRVVMTGCPVWYDIPSFSKAFVKKKEIKKIVFTTPADIRLFGQTLRVLRMLKREFPKAEIIVSFHRGIKRDQFTGMKSSLIYTAESFYAQLKGMKVVDVSYNLDRINFYSECDLHVGFRVHAHLYFLSKRLPSVLISEDGRGTGMAKTFGLPDFLSTDPMLDQKIRDYLAMSVSCRFENMVHTASYIDGHFPIMLDFLEKIKALP
jgi:hypothetical protein